MYICRFVDSLHTDFALPVMPCTNFSPNLGNVFAVFIAKCVFAQMLEEAGIIGLNCYSACPFP